eukprot:m.254550 g.254550  ORF g.254550 m.254550 type:complete len:203 (+) comp19007_c0_seq1:199-807(+)
MPTLAPTRRGEPAATASGHIHTPPTMDVLQELKQQHTQIKGQFDKINGCHGEDRRAAVLQLREFMAAHEKFEEEILHPTARAQLPDGPKVVGARTDEEQQEKQLLSQLEGQLGNVDASEFNRIFQELRTRVFKHISAEESEEFTKLLRAMNKDPAIAQRMHKMGEQAHIKSSAFAQCEGECPHPVQCPKPEEERPRDVELTR